MRLGTLGDGSISLPVLRTIGGFVQVQDRVNALILPELQTVGGFFNVFADEISSVEVPKLRTVNSVNIASNPLLLLADFSGLESLGSQGGDPENFLFIFGSNATGTALGSTLVMRAPTAIVSSPGVVSITGNRRITQAAVEAFGARFDTTGAEAPNLRNNQP